MSCHQGYNFCKKQTKKLNMELASTIDASESFVKATFRWASCVSSLRRDQGPSLYYFKSNMRAVADELAGSVVCLT